MAEALRLTFKSCESPCFLHCGNDGTQDQQAESRKKKKRIFQVVFKFLVNPIYIPTPTVGLFNPSLATVRHGIEQLEPAEDRPVLTERKQSTAQIYSAIGNCVAIPEHRTQKNISLSSPGLLSADKITESNTNHIHLSVSLP